MQILDRILSCLYKFAVIGRFVMDAWKWWDGDGR